MSTTRVISQGFFFSLENINRISFLTSYSAQIHTWFWRKMWEYSLNYNSHRKRKDKMRIFHMCSFSFFPFSVSLLVANTKGLEKTRGISFFRGGFFKKKVEATFEFRAGPWRLRSGNSIPGRVFLFRMKKRHAAWEMKRENGEIELTGISQKRQISSTRQTEEKGWQGLRGWLCRRKGTRPWGWQETQKMWAFQEKT